MFTPDFHKACSLALERLAAGASLTDVLGLVVEAAEHDTGGICVVSIRDRSGGIRVSSTTEIPEHVLGQIDRAGMAQPGVLPHLGVWWEPIRGEAGPIGAFITLRSEPGVPSEKEQSVAAMWAHLCGIAIERKRREDELRDRESEISAVLETVLDGIITIDQRGIVETFNRAAEKMFGYAADEVVGRNVSMLMGEADARQHDEYIRRYLETGRRRIIGIGREVLARKKDGTLFPIELGVSEFRVGDTRKFTGLIHDLTERKKLEAEFLRSQKLEAIGTLAAGVAHDFNNLLMGIMGCASMALSKLKEDSPARMYLQEARTAAERGSKLTRQLLAFSRRAPAEVRPMSINDVVSATDMMLGRFLRENVELATDLLPAGGTIMGDAAQIEQILVNLVVNARDAMEDGGRITIRTREAYLDQRPNGPRGHYVYLEVEDDGCGMDEATRARIFEPFFTTKGPDRGTGLGLSTVYGIVEQHDGFLEVESELGRGTVVRVYFPRSTESSRSEDPASLGTEKGRGLVLVVEDDHLVRLTVTDLLRELGYDVREAANGAQALEVVQQGAWPDVLVTDLVMPDMNGLDLVARIQEKKQDLKTLLMSGYVDQRTVTEYEERGLSFIAKPFSGEILARKLRELLS